jgi:HEPN domain-containing protein
MLDSGRYLYVVFCCQQAVEKALKAIIIEKTGELAPRTHDLIRLSELSQLDFSDEQKSLFERLSDYYVKTRYPDGAQALSNTLTKQSAGGVMTKTENEVQWLLSKLK